MMYDASPGSVFRSAVRGLAAAVLAIPVLVAPAVAAQWNDETLELFATLPVQDEGRVKPLDTLAQFTLLGINGKRSFTPDGEGAERLTHLEWFLTCMFYPEQTGDWKHFIVDNSELITAMGIETHGAKRDRYAYNELQPGRAKLFELAQAAMAKEAANRSTFETQALSLAESMLAYEKLTHYLDFAFTRFKVEGDTNLAKAFPETDGVPFSVAIERGPAVLASLRGNPQGLSDEQVNAEVSAFGQLMEQIDTAGQTAVMAAFFPPADPNEIEWLTPADMRTAAFMPGFNLANRTQLLGHLEQMALNKDQPEVLHRELQALHTGLVDAATQRGEYSKVPLEVHFYQAQYLWYSLYLFVLSFILIAFSWLLPYRKWVLWTTWTAVAVPTVLLIAGITLRCIIRERPPVATLYETVLFITAIAVSLALIIEFLNRQRIAVAVASILGVMGMFLAFRYEAKDGNDTIGPLIAVLDTNFWLATHVTTVTIGYAAGMLAAAIAHIYLIGRAFNLRKDDRRFYRSVTKMSYGVMCFSLLFSTVGTILGGIWANDSWGRFWGWDPKENGALMIVLWTLVVLHAKMGRYIRDTGIQVGAIMLGCIVAFSWWGVNNLGVGLHSYGFTSGLWMWLSLFWGSQVLVMMLGVVVFLRDRVEETALETQDQPTKPAQRSGKQKPQPAS